MACSSIKDWKRNKQFLSTLPTMCQSLERARHELKTNLNSSKNVTTLWCVLFTWSMLKDCHKINLVNPTTASFTPLLTEGSKKKRWLASGKNCRHSTTHELEPCKKQRQLRGQARKNSVRKKYVNYLSERLLNCVADCRIILLPYKALKQHRTKKLANFLCMVVLVTDRSA